MAGEGFAALRALRDKWRQQKAIVDTYHATMGMGWGSCADDLDALLGGGDARVAVYKQADGDRCAVCMSRLRDAAGDPVVALRIVDLEDIACLLVDYVDCPQVWGPTIKRIEQAVGRTVAQMKADLKGRR